MQTKVVNDFREDEARKVCWCMGLPMANERPFTEAERADLYRKANRSRWLALSAWVTAPLTFFGIICLVANVNGPLPAATVVALMTVFMISIAAVALQFRKLREWGIESRGWKADAESGSRMTFSGRYEQINREDVAFRQLSFVLVGDFRPDFLQSYFPPPLRANPEDVLTLEVLSASGFVIAVNQIDTSRRPIRASVASTTAAPEIAQIAAQWLQPVAVTDAGMAVSAGFRELDAAEKSDLEKKLRRFRGTTLGTNIPGIFLCLFVGVPMFLGPSSSSEKISIGSIFFGIIGLLVIFQTIAALRLGLKIRQDIDGGRVQVVEISAPPHAAAAIGKESSDAPPFERLRREILPRSRVAWTEDDEPALWRKLGKPTPDVIKGGKRRSQPK